MMVLFSGLYQSKPLWDSWFQSGRNGVLAKAEAIQEAKNMAASRHGYASSTYHPPHPCRPTAARVLCLSTAPKCQAGVDKLAATCRMGKTGTGLTWGKPSGCWTNQVAFSRNSRTAHSTG